MDSGAPTPSEDTDFTDGIRVRDVVRDVVVEVAKEELPLVAGLARFDDAVVVRRLRRGRERREPLGFGFGEVATLVTPVVWLAVDEAARWIGDVAADGAATGMKAVLRKVLRRKAAAVVIPVPTREQLPVIHQLVLETGVQRGLGEEQARMIADAVVARLVGVTSGNGTQGPPDDPGNSASTATPAGE
ncbi:MAG: hypothetical protein ACRDRS_13070 [Pseudonocardiaceae bacterium]